MRLESSTGAQTQNRVMVQLINDGPSSPPSLNSELDISTERSASVHLDTCNRMWDMKHPTDTTIQNNNTSTEIAK